MPSEPKVPEPITSSSAARSFTHPATVARHAAPTLAVATASPLAVSTISTTSTEPAATLSATTLFAISLFAATSTMCA